MSNDLPPPPEPRIGSPESFGWQRRPEYDTQSSLAYEAPDGMLKAFPRDRTPELARLNVKLPSLRDYKT